MAFVYATSIAKISDRTKNNARDDFFVHYTYKCTSEEGKK